MVPSGLLPLVVLATYCKQEAPQVCQVRLARPVSRGRDLAEKAQQCASSPLEFKLKVRFHGSWEEFSLQAHDLRAHFSELGGKPGW